MNKKRIYYGTEDRQFGDLYLSKEKNAPLVILIHGGYWKDNKTLDNYATINLIAPLLEQGCALWNVEYRSMDFVGENISAPWPIVLQDCEMAVEYIKNFDHEQIDLNKTLIIGHSAGGHLATWLASRKNIAEDSLLYNESPFEFTAYISIAGVINFNEGIEQPQQILRLLGGTKEQVPTHYQAADPFLLLNNINERLILVHGAKDPIVPVSHSQTYFKAAKNKNIVYHELANADHFSMLEHPGQQEWHELLAIITNEINFIKKQQSF